MKVAVVIGTRPEIIKMSPLVRELQIKKINFFVIHSNQHYSKELDENILKDLNLKKAKYNLGVGSGSQAEQTARILERIEKVFLKEKPDVALVQGDTNTVLAAALAAKKLHIKVGHIEAGLRSYDEKMPEEINRIMTDHISDFCFAPTIAAAKNLIKEGINKRKIFTIGNTVVDAVYQNSKIANKRSKIISRLGLNNQKYGILTIHRPSNVDSKESLRKIFRGIKTVNKNFGIVTVFPAHPRTEKMIQKSGMILPKSVRLVEPLGYLDFLHLMSQAAIILTDSGGIQEESCILKVPCVTLRDNTERPETITVGSNVLAGQNQSKIVAGAKKMIVKNKNWKNPFGNGTAAKKIVNILVKEVR